MKGTLAPGEEIVKQSPANLQRGLESVGGELYLTNQRLVFTAHKFNVQDGTTEIDLKDISDSKRCWTKFLGFLPLVPNSLAIQKTDGTEYRFALMGRSAWAVAIGKQIDA